MLEDYKSALRAGQRAYRACVARGQSPYLAVLDDILVNVNIVAQEPLGLVEIRGRQDRGHCHPSDPGAQRQPGKQNLL